MHYKLITLSRRRRKVIHVSFACDIPQCILLIVYVIKISLIKSQGLNNINVQLQYLNKYKYFYYALCRRNISISLVYIVTHNNK